MGEINCFIKWCDLSERRRAKMFGKLKAPLVCLPLAHYFVVDVDEYETAVRVLQHLRMGLHELVGSPIAWIPTSKGVHLIWPNAERYKAAVQGDTRYTYLSCLDQCWPIWALDKVTHSPRKAYGSNLVLVEELNQLFDQSSLMFGAQ